MLPVVLVTAACADDGTAAPGVMGRLTAEHRSRSGEVWSDGEYHNHGLDARLERSEVGYRVGVVSRPAGSEGFALPHRRRVVERTFAGPGRYRRDSRGDEGSTDSSEAVIRVCSTHRALRLSEPGESREPAAFEYRELQASLNG